MVAQASSLYFFSSLLCGGGTAVCKPRRRHPVAGTAARAARKSQGKS
jgi:hypothetical protein